MILAIILGGFFAPQAAGKEEAPGHYTLYDRDGSVITMAGRELDPGDHYIAADNRLFEIKEIRGVEVYVEYLETIELPAISEEFLKTQAAKGGGVIGIYHTHNAESYVPTSGTDAKEDGRGDILAVGKSLAAALEQAGITALWSENSHLPHDGQAYLRSRRTAAELLKKGPETLIDVHRDATPPEVYEAEVEGMPVTKVRLVVGRQNQNRAANLEYAKRIKAVADKLYPGIIEGIFDARGNYNQDLGPKMILLEFGAHTNKLEHAEQAAKLFAKVIPAAAGLGTGEQTAQKQLGGAAGRALVWLIAVAAVVGIAFVLIDQGRLGSLGAFFRREAGLGEDDERERD